MLTSMLRLLLQAKRVEVDIMPFYQQPEKRSGGGVARETIDSKGSQSYLCFKIPELKSGRYLIPSLLPAGNRSANIPFKASPLLGYYCLIWSSN